jgi:hypothetical protein
MVGLIENPASSLITSPFAPAPAASVRVAEVPLRTALTQLAFGAFNSQTADPLNISVLESFAWAIVLMNLP